MPLSPDAILAIFPNTSLTKIEGESSYSQLCIIQKEMNANAASVPSHLGCGQYGLLALTMSPTVYSTISSTPVTAPTNPGPTPNVSGVTASYKITKV